MSKRHKGPKKPPSTKPPATTTSRGEKIDTTASATALAHQLENRHQELNTLHARVRAYQARLNVRSGTEHRPHQHDPHGKAQEVLEHLASALLLADLAVEALSGTPLNERTGSGGSNFDRAVPGAGTNLARARARELRDAVTEALDRFDWSSENGWRRKPKEESTIPEVRCRTQACPARDVWVKAWRVIRGGRTIYHQVCSSCGTPYPPTESQMSTTVQPQYS